MSNIQQMKANGQSAWLNYLRRSFIDSGELRQAVDSGISGITSSPAVFERAITCSSDYDQVLQRIIKTGVPVREIYLALVVDDIQRAADVLHQIFESSAGEDGYVTVELDPGIAHDAVGTVAEARHLLALINRPNVMVEVPATESGIAAIRALIKDGVNVNATHIFAISTYEKVADAYIEGIQSYLESHSVWRQNPSSVASFSISRIDGVVDDILEKKNIHQLQGKTGIALAKMVYLCFRKKFSGKEWDSLARKGANVQRPKWTRTTPRSFKYPLVHYIEPLVGMDTVCTLSPATFHAVREQRLIASSISEDLDLAQSHISTIASLGIDLETIGLGLQEESLSTFSRYFEAMIESVIKKRNELDFRWHRVSRELGPSEPAIREGLRDIARNRVMFRIWSQDHTVWTSDPAEIRNRMGWLHVLDVMQENLVAIHGFFTELKKESFESVLFIGSGGASLAAKIFVHSSEDLDNYSAHPSKELNVQVLGTVDPTTVLAFSRKLDLEKTLIFVADKSGGSTETMSLFRYYYNQMVDAVGLDRVGRHLAAITDPGSDLALTAHKYRFRKTFLNDPKIGTIFSPLSYFGIIPAAMAGMDLSKLLGRAQAMACNAASCNRAIEGDNLAAVLGTILGQMALVGRDTVCFLTSPGIKSLAEWAVQLLNSSTGGDGHKIFALVDEGISSESPLKQDTLIIYLRMEPDPTHDRLMESITDDGFPVVTIEVNDRYDLGGLIFLWQMAAAVAAYHLDDQPFGRAEIDLSTHRTPAMIAQFKRNGELPSWSYTSPARDILESFLAQAKHGDYVVIQPYLPLTGEVVSELQKFRNQLQDHYHVTATVGSSPRITSGREKQNVGERRNCYIIQLVYELGMDIPIPDLAGQSTSSLSFNLLQRFLCLEAAESLQKLKQPLVRFNLQNDIIGGLKKLSTVQAVPAVAN